MLGLTSSEISNCVFIKTKEIYRFEIFKNREKIITEQRFYPLEDLKIQFENLKPQDRKDEEIRPIVFDDLKEMGFIDVNLMLKILRFTEDIDSLETTNNAKVSILTPPLRDFEQSILQDFESFLRTNKLEESNKVSFGKF